MSLPEGMLWRILRTRPGGFKFRRQHPVGPYVLDFFCRAAAVALEIDGIAHDMGDNPARDEQRDAWLAGTGFARCG
jgi:very-short-patch-repair endonuclease